MNLEERSRPKFTVSIPGGLNTGLDNLLSEIECSKIEFVRVALGLMFQYLNYKEQGLILFYQKPDDLSSRIELNTPSYTYPSDPKKTKKFTAQFSKQVRDKLIDVAQRYGYSRNRVVIDSIGLLMQHIAKTREGYLLYKMKPKDDSSMVGVSFLSGIPYTL